MRPGDRAWLVLAAGVAAWDIIAPPGEMLSDASFRYSRTHKVVWHCTVIYFAGHLMHVWPKRYDPLSALARTCGR